MGLFSFLFGGGKKARAKAADKSPAAKAKVVEIVAPVAAASAPAASAPPAVFAGVVQAKLRLKLAASLRTGQHAVAYEAAKDLADIQIRAGRKTVARAWQEQAERIKAQAGIVA